MAVQIGTKEAKEVKEVKENKETIDQKELTSKEKLKLIYDALIIKYDQVVAFTLPNKKVVFFRPPTPQEYEVHEQRVEKIRLTISNPNKPMSGDTFSQEMSRFLCSLLLGEKDSTVIGSVDDFKKYPAAHTNIYVRVSELAGSNVEELTFLD